MSQSTQLRDDSAHALNASHITVAVAGPAASDGDHRADGPSPHTAGRDRPAWFDFVYDPAHGKFAHAITIDRVFSCLTAPLSRAESDKLEAEIRALGYAYAPLITWKVNGVQLLLDGHNRFRKCIQGGWAFWVLALDLADWDAAWQWILKNQDGRRNLRGLGLSHTRGLRYNLMKGAHGGVRAKAASVPSNVPGPGRTALLSRPGEPSATVPDDSREPSYLTIEGDSSPTAQESRPTPPIHGRPNSSALKANENPGPGQVATGRAPAAPGARAQNELLMPAYDPNPSNEMASRVQNELLMAPDDQTTAKEQVSRVQNELLVPPNGPNELGDEAASVQNELLAGTVGNDFQANRTAALLAHQYKTSVSTIKRDGRLSAAVERIAGRCGDEGRIFLLSPDSHMRSEDVDGTARLPEDEQRQVVALWVATGQVLRPWRGERGPAMLHLRRQPKWLVEDLLKSLTGEEWEETWNRMTALKEQGSCARGKAPRKRSAKG